MSHSSSASLLDVNLQPGKPAVLRADAAGDAPGWAAEHRDALRAVVAEHGCVLVRGLGLRDAAGTGSVFRQLAAAWAQVLGLAPDQIGRHDNFFDLGGTSLSAVKLAIALDRAVSLKELIRHPVLAGMAALLGGKPTASS